MRLKGLYSVLCFVLSGYCVGQTNPTAQSIPYSQNFSSLAWTSTTYPAGWQGWQLGGAATGAFRLTAPTGDLALVASGDATAVTTGVYNYNDKIGFLQSASGDPGICLAIVTTGLTGITVNYDAMTLRNPYDGTTNTRINEFGLQYRIGTTGAFTNISSGLYQNNTTLQTTAVTTPQNVSSKSVLLPAACDNQAVVQIRWVGRQVSGAGARPSFALDNVTVTSCTTNTSTYYYRSSASGSWNYYGTWEASPDGLSGWIMACSFPTSAAAAVTIQSGHTVVINTNATAPNLTIAGTLTFDGVARTVVVTDYITISTSGIFITQSSGTATHSLTIGGNVTNNGTFNMTRLGTTLLCNVTFNKNGNQTFSGTGTVNYFNYITVNLGTSRNNILEINLTNANFPAFFLHSVAGSPNDLLNGTIKFSGSFTFTGNILRTGIYYNIPSTAGIWINNPNVTISGQADSYDVSGLLRITSGGMYAGTTNAHGLRLLTGSSTIIEGGILEIGGRLQAADELYADQYNLAYRQSGGTVTICRQGQNTISLAIGIADLYLPDPTDSLIMSGGTMIFTNEAQFAADIYHYGTSIITGGVFQVGVAASTVFTTAGFEIEAGSAIPTLTITQPGSLYPYVYLGENLTVIGSINIAFGTTFDNLWDATDQYDISLTNTWNNSGTFIHNNVKTVTFNGASTQAILGITSTFNNLTINNSWTGVSVMVQTTIVGTGVLTLIDGLVNTFGPIPLTMNAGSSVTGASNNSFVNGPMKKIGTTDFVFPVGKNAEYRPIAISNLSGSETFTAEYFHTDPNPSYNVTLKDATLDDIGRCEYWILDRAGATVSATVALSWDTYSCGVTSLPDLAVARWNGSTWKDEGNTATTGAPDPSTGTVSSGTITSFSPFTLASRTAGVNPLPIELLFFSANYNSTNQVDVKWSTASEINNDYFTVERSADAVSFDAINVTDGAGNSNRILNYTTTDDSPLNGISYYRLKQTDFDATYKYSSTVSVQKNTTDFEIINAHYTLSQNEFAIYFNCNSNCLITIELFDVSGKKVYSSFENTLGKNSEIVFPTTNLNEGVYIVKAYNGNKLVSKKVKL